MRIASIFAGLAFLVLTACHGGRLTTPSGFATLEEGGAYSYRATNAEGVVLGVRTEDNDVKANVNFWADALDLRLRSQGYAPLAKPSETRTRGGLVGRQMRYEVTRDGRTARYWLTVFATAKKVYVVEAAGDKEVFDSASPLVESAIESLKM